MGEVVRYCRAAHEGALRCGVVEGDRVRLLAGDLSIPGGTIAEIPLASAALAAPVAPAKIVCAGLNYRAHATEMGHPLPAEQVIFLKPPTACIGPWATIVRPPESRRVDHEAELAVVIGRRIRSVTQGDWRPRQSLATPARTTSPPATCRHATASGRVPRASTPSAPSDPGSSPASIRGTSPSRPS